MKLTIHAIKRLEQVISPSEAVTLSRSSGNAMSVREAAALVAIKAAIPGAVIVSRGLPSDDADRQADYEAALAEPGKAWWYRHRDELYERQGVDDDSDR